MALTFADEPLTSWGRVLRRPHKVARPRSLAEAERLVAGEPPLLAVGLSRSYGDSGLNPEGRIIGMRGLDRFIAFDPEAGILRAEAGVSLDEVLRLTVPRGWFLPTTPGTRYVTLGGAVANDVHGKNHHRAGSFGRHVRRLGLVRSDLGAVEASPTVHADLFHGTLGGLGLTGLITWVELALSPISSSDILEETVPFGALSDFFRLSVESEATHEFVSAWVDCTVRGPALGRGVLFCGNWASDGPLEPHSPRGRLTIPAEAPPGLLNSVVLKGFNTAYYALQQAKRGLARVPYASAFYPLDAIGGWNRLYGPRGFFQHQFVVPPAAMEDAVAEVLRVIAAAGQGSFLAVLKIMGPLSSGGLTSFQGPGASLALDFPNRGGETLQLLQRLDAIVIAAGGRLYPAKDGRMSSQAFQSGYPRWAELERLRDPLFSSSFWRRVTS
jgi:FAD/FMN-containing dehydrogenase